MCVSTCRPPPASGDELCTHIVCRKISVALCVLAHIIFSLVVKCHMLRAFRSYIVYIIGCVCFAGGALAERSSHVQTSMSIDCCFVCLCACFEEFIRFKRFGVLCVWKPYTVVYVNSTKTTRSHVGRSVRIYTYISWRAGAGANRARDCVQFSLKLPTHPHTHTLGIVCQVNVIYACTNCVSHCSTMTRCV